MATYIIYRRGSNAANQSLCDRAVVGIVEARGAENAVATAHAELGVTCYANQHLTAKLWSRASNVDREEADPGRPVT